MSDTPTADPTDPTDPTAEVAATGPAPGPAPAAPPVPPTPPVAPPGGAAPPPSTPAPRDSRSSWGRRILIGVGALVLTALVFGAGVAVGFVGGRWDRFDHRDRLADRFDEIFGSDERRDRRGRIEDCLDPGRRGDDSQDCAAFPNMPGRGNPNTGMPGRGPGFGMPGRPGQQGQVGVNEDVSSGPDQPVIVYPDGRVVPLTPNTNGTTPTPAPSLAPTSPTSVAPSGT